MGDDAEKRHRKRRNEKLQTHKGEQLRRVIEVSDEREERFFEDHRRKNDGEGVIKYWLGMLMIDASHDPGTYQLIRLARRVGEVVAMSLQGGGPQRLDPLRSVRPSCRCSGLR